MKNFKKRTIALILASVITVAGSFAEENYKNTLMGIDFLRDKNGSGALSLVVKTKNQYTGNVIPTKKDGNTYILMLPEVNSKASIPDITKYNGYVEKITINTLPYTSSGNGYTRIVIKTSNVPFMHGQNMLYLPSKEELEAKKQQQDEELRKREAQEREERLKREQEQKRLAEQRRLEAEQEEKLTQRTEQQEEKNEPQDKTSEENISTPVSETTDNYSESVNYVQKTSKTSEGFLLVLGVLLIVACSVYLYIKAKDKLRDIAGESLQIEVDDLKEKKEKKEKKQKKSEKIKNTIKTLDATYSKTAVPKRNEYQPVQPEPQKVEEIEEVNVVDLDELFKEKVNIPQVQENTEEDEENLALEEFLNGFSFDEDTFEDIEIEHEIGYDAEFYEELIKTEDVKFTNDDIERINKLLNTELSDTTLKDLENYLISNPIKRKRTKKEILEEFVTTYAISQDVVFTQNDTSILEKLINVEIDLDFVKDLRTSPKRTAEMEEEIKNQPNTPKKPAINSTLNVKDLLPDLSEALKQQGGKEIKSEAKATTVYFSKGYEVQTLTIDADLPDLSKEIKNKSAYKSKPSAAYQLVDDTYQVEKLSLKDVLPDLKDVMAHPEKYQKDEPKDVVVDEEALLNNISNVSFKPFYDGTQKFEVLNDIEEMDNLTKNEIEEIEIKEEKLAVTAVKKEEKTVNNIQAPKEIKKKENKIEQKPVKKVESEPLVQLNRTINSPVKKERKPSSADVLKRIEERRKQLSNTKPVKKETIVQKEIVKETTKDDIKCIVGGESYKVISTTNFTENKGCYLTKNENGYTVLGFVGDKTFKIKDYQELKSEKIQSRKNEDLDNGEERYIVRIGINKFVVNVSANDIKYIMDLC